jgi:saccharopine dehydrogenase-like NADP-dependent oxidoreductase
VSTVGDVGRGFGTFRIPLHVTEIATLVRMGLLTEERRQEDEALQTAILSIIYRALEDAATTSSNPQL